MKQSALETRRAVAQARLMKVAEAVSARVGVAPPEPMQAGQKPVQELFKLEALADWLEALETHLAKPEPQAKTRTRKAKRRAA